MPRTTKAISISLEQATLRKGKRLARARGFKQSFSAYVADAIERDAAALLAVVRRAPEAPAKKSRQPMNGKPMHHE